MKVPWGRIKVENVSVRFLCTLAFSFGCGWSFFNTTTSAWGQDERIVNQMPNPSERIVVPDSLNSIYAPAAVTPRTEMPYLIEPNQPLPARDSSISGDKLDLQALDIEPAPLPRVVIDLYQDSQTPYRYYRSDESCLGFVSSGSDELGWTTMDSNYYSKRDKADDFNFGTAHHWLSGPSTPDLPARVHDFVFGYQRRRTIADRFSYDIATSVGVYSDFEGSARQGVRFVSHAVGVIHAHPALDFIFGVDYLDRDDIKILPVIGWSWHAAEVAPIRLDLVFPRPRIELVLDPQHRVYLQG